jgi:hypothetical protein
MTTLCEDDVLHQADCAAQIRQSSESGTEDDTLKCDLEVDVRPDDGVVIDDSNFDQFFFDVRRHDPKPGQVMARFVAMADFVDSQMKRDVVYLLRECRGGGNSAQRVMLKLGGAVEEDSIRVLREMAADLMAGLTPDEVCQKPYRYKCQFFYYTDKVNVPDDPHWSIIQVAKKGATEVNSTDIVPTEEA